MPYDLRPHLNKRLTYLFGPVNLIGEREAMCSHTLPAPSTGRHARWVLAPGQTFVLTCPFCKGPQLFLNHMWGHSYKRNDHNPVAWDPEDLELATCFGGDCLRDPKLARLMHSWVYDVYWARDSYLAGWSPAPGPRYLDVNSPARPPGLTLPLHYLPWDHPARAGLQGRAFDLDWLGRTFNVGFCPLAQPEYAWATGKVIAPVAYLGGLVGWHALDPGGAPAGAMPGLEAGRFVYNIDRARNARFAVLCASMEDVWRFGPEAVALLGTAMSAAQAELVRETWREGAVIVLLPGAAAAAAARRLRTVRSCVVPLPGGKAPSEFPAADLRRLVYTDGRVRALLRDAGATPGELDALAAGVPDVYCTNYPPEDYRAWVGRRRKPAPASLPMAPPTNGVRIAGH
jgi:hypothetical protein